ncbi:Alpha-ketoglutarate/sugar transporter [Acetobacteraceae bacterium EV16G]|uniref:Alpha-ketoglutarate/sugar transporter n=1 Tax=Sorlinia euscelidii TaxID=3081148 RepID=A0ABU7U444_9PROT
MAGGTFIPDSAKLEVVKETVPDTAFGRFLSWIGIPPVMLWGYVGVLLFMIGDGVESGYLSPYLVGQGFKETDVALLFTIYGVTAALSSWLSGALSELWGSRTVMIVGLLIWTIFQVGFLSYGLPSKSFSLIALFYGIRGFGYPLFAFGFLVWVVHTAPASKLGSAAGWFWFCFTAGLPTLGSTLASIFLPIMGSYYTLWLALGIVVIGGSLALYGIRGAKANRNTNDPNALRTLFSALSIAWERPKVGIGCIVRAIDTSAEFGLLVFMPLYFRELNFTTSQWLAVLQAIFMSNVFFNLIFGICSDRISWRGTVMVMGGLGSTITTMVFFYAPTLLGPEHLYIVMAAGALYGATLAAYVPLTALMPYLAPENKAAAMSLLNLGAGASVWIGPAIVFLFIDRVGVKGVMMIYAAIYFSSAIMTYFLRMDPEVEAEIKRSREGVRSVEGKIESDMHI